MTSQSKKARQPISSVESPLITALEFVRVALAQYPNTADKVLTYMDLSDEAFQEDMKTLGDAIGFDFNDSGETDGSTTESRDSNPV